MHTADFADAMIFLMENIDYEDLEGDNPHADGIVNVGTGEAVTIKSLLAYICNVTEKNYVYPHWDTSKPNGVPSKLMDSNKMKGLGWTPKIPLKQGIKQTYEWFINNSARNKPVERATGT